MQLKDFSFQSPLKTQLYVREGEQDAPVVLLMHGYGQSGEDILVALENCFPKSWTLVAPNAPYPFYNSKQKKLVYSWYFFDSDQQLFVVDRQAARSMISQLLPQFLKPELSPSVKWFVVGFSQGGYMAPFVADPSLNSTLAPEFVVTLNGRLRHEDLLTWPIQFPIVALHGARDEIVDVEKSKHSADLLREAGWDIQFKTVSTSEHSLDKALIDEVAQVFKLKS